MGISSIGIGSGIDVESLISKMTALEQQPLNGLIKKAAAIQSQVSVVGQIKSQVSSLAAAADKLALAASWTGVTVGSSNSSAVTGTATAGTAPTSFSMNVQQLAQAQSTSSTAVAAGTALGTGSLSIAVGTWNYAAVPPAFTPGTAAAVNVTIGVGEDNLSTIATKINAANAGVTATVLQDVSGQRLLVRSNATGEAAGFQIKTTGAAGLASLAFDPSAGATGMAANAYQKGLNMQATINSIAVSSATNQLAGTIPGVTLQVASTTTSPVTVTVASDTASMQKNVQDFVASYNALNQTLMDATKYDAASKTAGPLQGDSIIVGLQNALRSLLGSSSVGSTFSRLADVGLNVQRGGIMTIDSTKLSAAMQDPTNLQKLFNVNNNNAQTNGFGLKVSGFLNGLLAADGSLSNETTALQTSLKKNSKDQDAINTRVAQLDKRLRQQYTALDTKMAGLTALNSYITQQVTQWNK